MNFSFQLKLFNVFSLLEAARKFLHIFQENFIQKLIQTSQRVF